MSASPIEEYPIGVRCNTMTDGSEAILHAHGSIVQWNVLGEESQRSELTDTAQSWFLDYLVRRPNEPMMSSEVQLTAEETGHWKFKPKTVFNKTIDNLPLRLKPHFMHFGTGKGGWYVFCPTLPVPDEQRRSIADIANNKIRYTAKKNGDHTRQLRKRQQVVDDYIDFLSGERKEKFSKKKIAGAVAFVTVGSTVVWKLASHYSHNKAH